MKLKNIVLFGLAFFGALAAFAGEAMLPLVQGEYNKVQAELQSDMSKSRKILQELQVEKRKAVQDSENLARTDRLGIESLKRYDLLLVSRYVNDSGEYQPGLEISQKDVDNLNTLTQTYLKSAPFIGRVSAGHARRLIDWGMKRLEELSKTHSSPTEQNNSDLEIVAKRQRDAETKVKTVTLLAQRLGVSLNENSTGPNVAETPNKPAELSAVEQRSATSSPVTTQPNHSRQPASVPRNNP